MTFAWPHLLLLLLVPASLLALRLRRRQGVQETALQGRILGAEADASSLRLSGRQVHAQGGRKLRPWTLLALSLGIIALARPQWGIIEEPVFEQSREILIGLDLSRSMQTEDIKPSRLARAKLLIQSLMDRLKGERLGLVVFSGTAFLQSPLSTDYEILRDLLPDLGPDFLPEGGTAYKALLGASLDAFSSTANADRFLVILSDGEALDEDWKSLLPGLKEKNIRVIGLGVGTAQGGMVPDGKGGLVKDERGAVVLSKLEPATLGELASATQGVYQDASTWVDLSALIRETVEKGRQGGFVEKRAARHEERFQWPLACALACALAALLLEFPARLRPRRLGPSPASTTAALLLLVTLASLRPLHAADTKEAPLIETIRTLSTQDNLVATDYARIATQTLDWGKGLKEAGQPLPPGTIRDGLEAVSRGSALNNKAADWPTLKKSLEALLQQKEKPKQKPEDKKDQPQDKQENQDKNPDSGQKQEPSQPEEQKKPEPQQKEPESSQEKQPQDSQAQKAFDQLQKPEPQPTQPEEMQSVGGQEKKEAPEKENPAMVLPLEKLEKIKELDSPGRLFQMMEQDDKGKKPAPAKGPRKNW